MDITSTIGTLSPALLALIPIVMGVTQIAKSFISNERLVPVVSLILGILGAILVDGLASPGTTIIEGIVVGLTASGVYSQMKKAIRG